MKRKFEIGDRVLWVHRGLPDHSLEGVLAPVDNRNYAFTVVGDRINSSVAAHADELTLLSPKLPVSRKLYLIGSLRNPRVQEIAAEFRKLLPTWEVFDDWQAAGPEADDYWRDYEKAKGHDFAKALEGYAAKHVYEFDKHHLDTSDAAILILPAGKSGHLELGYMVDKGKYTAIMLDDDPDRFDVMYSFVDKVTRSVADIVEDLNER